MGVQVVAMSASLHYTPVRELHNYRDQYAPSFKPYTSSATYPGAETNKYKPDPKVSGAKDPHGSSEFAARAGEHGGSFYNHRPNEVGWTSGPYSGHDARHSGFNPGSHFFNSGYHQNPESNIELRRPFCGMTQSRTQKCSPLQESMRLMHTQRRNNHEFTPSLQEEDKLGPHAYGHYPDYLGASTTNAGGMWSSPRLGLESRVFHDGGDACRVTESGHGTWLKSDNTKGGQFDAPRWNDTAAGRVERSGMERGEKPPHADAHHE